MPRVALSVLLGLLATALGCADEPAPPRAALRPGDSLLAAPGGLRARGTPPSCVPAGLRVPLHALLTERSLALSADAWVEGAELQLSRAFLDRLGVRDDVGRWWCRPEVALDAPLGVAWLEHDGERVERVRADTGDPEHRWSDRRHDLLFWWDGSSGRLLAFGTRAPGALRHGFDARADDVGLPLFEPELAGLPRADDARAVPRAVALDGVTRPALAVRAPTTLELRVDALHAEVLELQLGVPALGLVRRGGGLRRDAAASDGVTFAVDLLRPGADDAARAPDAAPHAPTAERVWSLHVPPGERWVRAEVPLPAWVADGVVLRLVAEPGPDAHADFDHALWSGLRLRGGVARAPAHPHVILLDADTLRADRLGVYGAERDTSPRLDAWAAREAIVFEEARATADWTLPSTASLLTGLDVGRHGVVDERQRLRAEHLTLAQRLAVAGYETWARTDSGFVTPTYGFAAGFDVFDAGARDDERPRDGAELLERLARRRSERPVFVFFQTYEVHAPFEHDARFVSAPLPADDPLLERPVTREFVRDVERRQGHPLSAAQQRYVSELYDAGVARLDAQLGRFLDGLPDALGGQPFVLALTSDHGEELYDRGALGHGHSLHRELLHVPFLLRLPEGPRGVRRAEPVSGLDLVPTLLAAAGLPVPASLPGRVLLDAAPSDAPLVAQHRADAWALEWQGWKLLHGSAGRARGAPERTALFDVRADPAERVDLAGERPGRLGALLERLERWRAEHEAGAGDPGAEAELTPAELRALRELGYLEGG